MRMDERIFKKWIIPDPPREILRDPVIWDKLEKNQQIGILKNEIDAAIEANTDIYSTY